MRSCPRPQNVAPLDPPRSALPPPPATFKREHRPPSAPCEGTRNEADFWREIPGPAYSRFLTVCVSIAWDWGRALRSVLVTLRGKRGPGRSLRALSGKNRGHRVPSARSHATAGVVDGRPEIHAAACTSRHPREGRRRLSSCERALKYARRRMPVRNLKWTLPPPEAAPQERLHIPALEKITLDYLGRPIVHPAQRRCIVYGERVRTVSALITRQSRLVFLCLVLSRVTGVGWREIKSRYSRFRALLFVYAKRDEDPRTYRFGCTTTGGFLVIVVTSLGRHSTANKSMPLIVRETVSRVRSS